MTVSYRRFRTTYQSYLCSFGGLRSLEWWFLNDVAEQPFGPIFLEFLILKYGTDWLFRNVSKNYHFTLSNIKKNQSASLNTAAET